MPGYHQVTGLQIPVDDPKVLAVVGRVKIVGVRESLEYLDDDLHRKIDLESGGALLFSLFKEVFDRLSLYKLKCKKHPTIDVLKFECLDDVRVLQIRANHGLSCQELSKLRVSSKLIPDDLERNFSLEAPEGLELSQVDIGHRSLTERVEDSVAS
jgi:hypothetical protein